MALYNTIGLAEKVTLIFTAHFMPGKFYLYPLLLSYNIFYYGISVLMHCNILRMNMHAILGRKSDGGCTFYHNTMRTVGNKEGPIFAIFVPVLTTVYASFEDV